MARKKYYLTKRKEYINRLSFLMSEQKIIAFKQLMNITTHPYSVMFRYNIFINNYSYNTICSMLRIDNSQLFSVLKNPTKRPQIYEDLCNLFNLPFFPTIQDYIVDYIFRQNTNIYKIKKLNEEAQNIFINEYISARNDNEKINFYLQQIVEYIESEGMHAWDEQEDQYYVELEEDYLHKFKLIYSKYPDLIQDIFDRFTEEDE